MIDLSKLETILANYSDDELVKYIDRHGEEITVEAFQLCKKEIETRKITSLMVMDLIEKKQNKRNVEFLAKLYQNIYHYQNLNNKDDVLLFLQKNEIPEKEIGIVLLGLSLKIEKEEEKSKTKETNASGLIIAGIIITVGSFTFSPEVGGVTIIAVGALYYGVKDNFSSENMKKMSKIKTQIDDANH
jgi:hypothetical protein